MTIYLLMEASGDIMDGVEYVHRVYLSEELAMAAAKELNDAITARGGSLHYHSFYVTDKDVYDTD